MSDNKLSESSRARRLQTAREYYNAHTDEIKAEVIAAHGDTDQGIVDWFVARVKGSKTAAVEEDGWLFGVIPARDSRNGRPVSWTMPEYFLFRD